MDRISLDKQLVVALAEYLAQRPFREVFNFMMALQTEMTKAEVPPQPVPPAE